MDLMAVDSKQVFHRVRTIASSRSWNNLNTLLPEKLIQVGQYLHI